MVPLSVFQGDEHWPFHWQTQNGAVALLVHGFPGTPAEMRPLAQILHEKGWSANGILLPGFGPEIARLGSYHYQDWVSAITQELAAVHRVGRPILLIGYSLGAALAVHAAAQLPPDGLILLAPFWRLDAGWRGALLPVLKRVFPNFRPFEKADFASPEVRNIIVSFVPDADLDDPEVQAGIRQMSIPSKIIDEIRRAGQGALQKARGISMPVLAVQGRQDELVRTADTRKLAGAFPGPVFYREVRAGHNLISPEVEAWEDVKEATLEFAGTLSQSHPS
jgi:carboxylesterase